jgi:hypothetical protein
MIRTTVHIATIAIIINIQCRSVLLEFFTYSALRLPYLMTSFQLHSLLNVEW